MVTYVERARVGFHDEILSKKLNAFFSASPFSKHLSTSNGAKNDQKWRSLVDVMSRKNMMMMIRTMSRGLRRAIKHFQRLGKLTLCT